MKVMVIVHATKNSEAELSPGDEKMLAEMLKYNEQLVKSGVILAGEGLHPSVKGKRVVQPVGGKTKIVDGPFSETKELVGGFWIWQVKSMDEALEWAKRCPRVSQDDEEGILEIRPIFSTEDFAESDPSGKLRAKENELRKKTEKKQK